MAGKSSGRNRLYIETPIAESKALNSKLARRVFMKMECYQPSGSFKIRGISHLMSVRHDEGSSHFVCSSGGNAGLAVAYCGAILRVAVTVVVPKTTSLHVRRILAEYGAEVIVSGEVWNEADAVARDLSTQKNAAYVSPFDDRLLWQGHSTLIDEAAVQCDRPDAVVVSVGGGGLLCGVLTGMHRNGWTDVPVIAVETQGSASFAAAMKAGHPVQLDAITSVAKSLGALQIADEALAWTKHHEIHSVVLSDCDAIRGCIQLADEFRVLVEPACGVSRAAVESNLVSGSHYRNVLAVICGGSAVNLGSFLEWKLCLNREDRN